MQRSVPGRRADRVDHGGIQQGRLGRNRGTLPGRGCGFVRTEFFVSAWVARAENGRGDGRKSGDRRRGCRLGHESCEKTGLGKDDAERDAYYRTESRGVSRWVRRRERD